MDQYTQRIRQLNTLTKNEIIIMTDVLAFCSRTVSFGGDMLYRKIEAKLAANNNNLSCRITYSEFQSGPFESLAFILETTSDDVIIKPVNRQKYSKSFNEDYQLSFDFGLLEQSVKETYVLFSETLGFWDPEKISHPAQTTLTDNWCIIDEYSNEPETLKG